MNIYTTLVRPLLEYCVQLWSPHKVEYIKMIEKVQRRATRMVPQLRGKPYEERLKNQGWPNWQKEEKEEI